MESSSGGCTHTYKALLLQLLNSINKPDKINSKRRQLEFAGEKQAQCVALSRGENRTAATESEQSPGTSAEIHI